MITHSTMSRWRQNDISVHCRWWLQRHCSAKSGFGSVCWGCDASCQNVACGRDGV